MFMTYFKKKFTPTEYDVNVSIDQITTIRAIQVQQVADKKSIMVDAKTFQDGKETQIKISQG